MNNLYLAHHGILGMKWGIRRYQNPDGSLTEAGRRRYLNEDGSLNEEGKKREYDIAKKSQTPLYRSDYNRMLDYQKNSKIVQERSKELSGLADKARDLSLEIDDFQERDDVYDEAVKRSWELAKKDPGYGENGEKYDYNLMQYYLYDGDVLKKTTNELLKNDPAYQKTRKEYKDTIKEYKETCRRITNEIIGDYGKEKISGLGTDMNYEELVYYALSKPNAMWMFTYEEDMGRK